MMLAQMNEELFTQIYLSINVIVIDKGCFPTISNGAGGDWVYSFGKEHRLPCPLSMTIFLNGTLFSARMSVQQYHYHLPLILF